VDRRDFIKVIAGSMGVWSLAARAQQPRKLPTIPEKLKRTRIPAFERAPWLEAND
jgi:hypothetical protein